MRPEIDRFRVVAIVFGILAVGGFAWAIVRAQAVPKGPQPVAWDRQPCGHCQMHVGEPAFAAQLITKEGQVLHFDDPGCLLDYVAERRPQVDATWFHHHREDRWLEGREAGFVKASPTPMGYDLGAVDGSVPGAASFDEVLARAQKEALR